MAQQKVIPAWWSIFVTEYFRNGNNGSAAYQLARPKTSSVSAKANAYRLLANDCFKKFLRNFQDKFEAKAEMSRDEWLRLNADVARFDVRKYLKARPEGDVELADDWQTRADGHALEEIQVQSTTLESGAVVNRVKIKAAAKMKAIETIGKALGYLDGDRGSTTNNVTINFPPAMDVIDV